MTCCGRWTPPAAVCSIVADGQALRSRRACRVRLLRKSLPVLLLLRPYLISTAEGMPVV